MAASCIQCDMGSILFYHKYCEAPEDLLQLCISHGLILESKDCENCGKTAVLDINKKLFRCQKMVSVRKQKRRKCGWSQSMFANTFFDNVHLPLIKVLTFVNMYLRDGFSYLSATSEMGFSHNTINDWSSFCREVLIEWCIDHSAQLGGPGSIVEIDESKFGRRKHHVGRIIEGQWVFGGICRQTRRFFMVPVENRTSNTLLAIIKEKILPGTTIISDCWKAYDCLGNEGYQHLTVNHSVNFVDPDTQAHTNTVERLWRDAKRKVPLCGRRKKHFVGYLARTMFIMHHKDPNTRFHQFMGATAALYNPACPPQLQQSDSESSPQSPPDPTSPPTSSHHSSPHQPGPRPCSSSSTTPSPLHVDPTSLPSCSSSTATPQ